MRHLEQLAAALALVLALFSSGADAAERLRPRLDPSFVLAQVAAHLGVRLDPQAPPPAINLESNTPIARFQQAIGGQWGFRPHAFGNAYAVERNEIFLIDDPSYYARLGRSIDESLAHELAHYVQVRYLGADLAVPSWEDEAITVQHWFRDTHLRRTRAAFAP